MAHPPNMRCLLLSLCLTGCIPGQMCACMRVCVCVCVCTCMYAMKHFGSHIMYLHNAPLYASLQLIHILKLLCVETMSKHLKSETCSHVTHCCCSQIINVQLGKVDDEDKP